MWKPDPAARESLTRALGLHAVVRHPAVVRPELVRERHHHRRQ
ncbi:hypothetical protein ACFYON_25675 [Micromonospora sp. NPDC005686]